MQTLLPESELKPVEGEMFAAFKKMADHVIDGRCENKQFQHQINSNSVLFEWMILLDLYFWYTFGPKVLVLAKRKWFVLEN